MKAGSVRMSRFVLSAALLWGACGGGESAPGPLRHTLDDMHLASVPLSEKQTVIQAKQEYDVALMEKAKAEADYQDLQTKLEIAHNEAEQAEIAERSAITEKEAADRSADLNRKNDAERNLRAAQLGRRAADAKLTFLKAQRQWLKKLIRWGQHNAYAKQAKLELEKARIAQARNIRPAGFELGNFERQYKERSEAAQRAKHEADKDRERVTALQKEWESKVREWESARGIKPAAPPPAAGAPSRTP